MRIACVYFPHLYMQIEKLTQPQLEGYPVIIGGMPEERSSVADCSEEAAAQGVFAGMSLRQAYHLCPEALFLPFGGRYGHVWEDILFALGAFTLRVEPTTPGLAYLDITEALKVYGNERTMASAIIQDMLTSLRVQVRVGVGNSRFIAKQAALSAWNVLIVSPGEEKTFLSLLPSEALPLPDKEKEHLRLLGLSTLKKVAGLSRKALISQFGSTGNVLFELVNGTDEKRPIPRRRNALCLERENTCEVPLQTSEEVRAVMEDMVAGLSDELNRMRLACRKVHLTLFLQDGCSLEKVLVMKKPTAEARHILERLSAFLEYLVVKSPVASFRLSVPDPVADQGDQEDLFRMRSVFAERLEGIRAYFDSRYGHTPVMKIEKGDERSRLPERRFRFTSV
jgi:nucleotidyltransferase/DNA polymerase involved in DNA repair